mmetsp:Transcript_10449/g.15519  ORF Transcript_10449/g.15519 Transcript_10449/m.15519 type:complete len:474 (-) Transcript_10449:578-1999(-)
MQQEQLENSNSAGAHCSPPITNLSPERYKDDGDSSDSGPKQIKRRPLRAPLTLSAFRGTAVRLTDCELGKWIEHLYDWPEPEHILGRGASSLVRLAKRKSDGRYFAVKCIMKHEVLRDKKRKLSELQLLQKMSHPNIVSLLDVFETETEIQLVMEYCAGGELFDVVERRRYSERDAAEITAQMLEALKYLHTQKIVHRDVKPENILLPNANDDTFVKLSDFGLARILNFEPDALDDCHYNYDVQEGAVRKQWMRQRAYSRVGSDYYSAPEVMLGGRQGYDESVDMYSLGVVIYILLCGFPPFENSLSRGSIKFPEEHWKDVSQNAKDLIRQLLSINPVARPTADEALRHSWIYNRSINISAEPMSPVRSDEMRKFNSMRHSSNCSSPAESKSVLSKRLHSLSRESQSTLTKRLHTLSIEEEPKWRKRSCSGDSAVTSSSEQTQNSNTGDNDGPPKIVCFGDRMMSVPPCVTPR